MAFSYIQSKFDFLEPGNTSLPLAFDSSVTASSLLICSVGWSSSTATCTVADNVNGSWTAVGTPQAGSGELAAFRMQMFYKIGASSGATTVTATLSTSLTNNIIAIHEYSGTSVSTDGTAAYTTGTGASHTTSSVTTTVTDAMVFAAAVNGFGFSAVTAPATARQISFSTGDYLASGAAGAKTIAFTGGANQANVSGIMAFKEGGGSTNATITLTGIEAASSAAVTAPPRPRPAHPYSEINLRM